MAMSVSRACGLRLRLSSLATPAYPAGTQSWHVVSRSYATESAVISKRRGAPSAKATHKSTNVSSASPKKVSVKVEERAAGHAGKDAAVADLRALPGSSKTKKTTELGKQVAAQSPPKAAPAKKLTVEEQQLQELEAIEYFKKVMKSADPFGQPIASSLGAQTHFPGPPMLTFHIEERCDASSSCRSEHNIPVWFPQGMVESTPTKPP